MSYRASSNQRHSNGGPYYKVRDRKRVDDISSEGYSTPSMIHQSQVYDSRTPTRYSNYSTKDTTPRTRGGAPTNIETHSELHQKMYRNFMDQLLEKNASKALRKYESKEERDNFTQRIPTEGMEENYRSNSPIRVAISPRTRVNPEYRGPYTGEEFIQAISPRYQVEGIFSHNYLAKKSPTKRRPSQERSANKAHNTSHSGSTSGYLSAKRNTVFDRLYQPNSLIQYYSKDGQNSELIGIKDIIHHAQEAVNRPSHNNNTHINTHNAGNISARAITPRNHSQNTARNTTTQSSGRKSSAQKVATIRKQKIPQEIYQNPITHINPVNPSPLKAYYESKPNPLAYGTGKSIQSVISVQGNNFDHVPDYISAIREGDFSHYFNSKDEIADPYSQYSPYQGYEANSKFNERVYSIHAVPSSDNFHSNRKSQSPIKRSSPQKRPTTFEDALRNIVLQKYNY